MHRRRPSVSLHSPARRASDCLRAGIADSAEGTAGDGSDAGLSLARAGGVSSAAAAHPLLPTAVTGDRHHWHSTAKPPVSRGVVDVSSSVRRTVSFLPVPRRRSDDVGHVAVPAAGARRAALAPAAVGASEAEHVSEPDVVLPQCLWPADRDESGQGHAAKYQRTSSWACPAEPGVPVAGCKCLGPESLQSATPADSASAKQDDAVCHNCDDPCASAKPGEERGAWRELEGVATGAGPGTASGILTLGEPVTVERAVLEHLRRSITELNESRALLTAQISTCKEELLQLRRSYNELTTPALALPGGGVLLCRLPSRTAPCMCDVNHWYSLL
jgi:hypothetical protein